MGYSVKWVKENLGVTRDMLRYYEKEKLLPRYEYFGRGNNYRYYNDEEIHRIWGIKVLIGIGFTAKEIFALMNDPLFDFDTAIAKKVKQLEHEHDQNVIHLEFAKTIKLTGKIPTVTQVGSTKFDEFLEYVQKNWNYYDDPRMTPFMKTADILINKPSREWSPNDVEYFYSVFDENFDKTMTFYTLHGYFTVLVDMQDLDYSSNTVQRIVKIIHNYIIDHNTEPELDGNITPLFIAKYYAPFFLYGDVARVHRANYGEEGCLFIAKALAYYGGLNLDEI
ncbi:MAG: MerR family transcriptional regulator [Ruminococcaceae bacterium]|nr:MerR family transcriptional regulator [Oscillospiraceae bacterium]